MIGRFRSRLPVGLRSLGLAALSAGLLLEMAMPVPAQSGDCTLVALANRPDLQVFRCGAGLTITAEQSARFRLLDRDGDGMIDGVSLRRRAVLIEYRRTRARPSFQIQTPHAIAAVRGTTWAVDVTGGTTAVFVVIGAVNVKRREAPDSVVVRRRQGIDVAPGSEPLCVNRRWSSGRSSALLARLGH